MIKQIYMSMYLIRHYNQSLALLITTIIVEVRPPKFNALIVCILSAVIQSTRNEFYGFI